MSPSSFVLHIKLFLLVLVFLEDSVISASISNFASTATTEEAPGDTLHGSVSQKVNPSQFTKLNLEVGELMGSRWALEQRQKITVYHSLEIVDAMLIDKGQLSLKLEFYLQQTWSVQDLKFPKGLFKPNDPPNTFITTKESALQHMWSPDSYISSSRDSGSAKSAALKTIIYIYPDMTISSRSKMFANVACSTNFKWYPIDRQACLLMIEGYTYHNDFVQYQWETGKKDPLFTKIERPLQYDLENVERSNGSIIRGTKGIQYPYVSVKFVFERKLGNSLIQVYIPTTFVVVLTWFSFWLGLDAIPGRISLLITSMLSLVTMHVGAKSTIPPVHYVTMMDTWMVTCMTFVFGAVFEFVIVKFMHWRLHQVPENRKKKAKEEEERRFEEYLRIMQMSMTSLPVQRLDTEQSNQHLPPPETHTPTPRGRNLHIIKSDELSLDRGDTVADSSMSSRFMEEGRAGDMYDGPLSIESWRELHLKFHQKCFGDHETWVKVDMCARVMFPLTFVIFNCIYWPILRLACSQEATTSIL